MTRAEILEQAKALSDSDLRALIEALKAELATRNANTGSVRIPIDIEANARAPLYAAILRPGQDRRFLDLPHDGPRDGHQRLWGEVELRPGDVLEVRIGAASRRRDERAWLLCGPDGRVYGDARDMRDGGMPGAIRAYLRGRLSLEDAVADLEGDEVVPDTYLVLR